MRSIMRRPPGRGRPVISRPLRKAGLIGAFMEPGSVGSSGRGGCPGPESRRASGPVGDRGVVQRGVEQHAERAERLPAPLRAEPDQHDVATAEPHVQRRRLAVQDTSRRADSPRRSGDPSTSILRERGAVEAFERREDRAAVDEDLRPFRHARHQRVRRIGRHLEDRAAREEVLTRRGPRPRS